jgi:D-3-phosphoglycerate dehydrogenase / 2-oxoglutarate reductase
MKILIATEKPFAPAAISLIRDVVAEGGHELCMLENYNKTEDLLSAVEEADALIVRSDKVTSAVISAAAGLKIIVRAGAGYDNIDLDACSRRNIAVMNTPGQNSNAVAELAFELMLYQARCGFAGHTGTELRNKTLGLHAFGNVGTYMAMIARGFGMNIFAFDPFIGENDMKRHGVTACKSIQELYSMCQYVSVHLPLTVKTNRSIGYELLSQMPEYAVLINTARKQIIDEDDLLRIMEDRSDFCYLSDGVPDSRTVFEEKYKGRFIFTEKKMGAQTREANIRSGIAAARQIIDYFNNGNEKFRVNS